VKHLGYSACVCNSSTPTSAVAAHDATQVAIAGWGKTRASSVLCLRCWCTHWHSSTTRTFFLRQALEQKIGRLSKGQSYDWESHEQEWTRRLQEVEMHWEKRLRDGWVIRTEGVCCS